MRQLEGAEWPWPEDVVDMEIWRACVLLFTVLVCVYSYTREFGDLVISLCVSASCSSGRNSRKTRAALQ